MSQSLVRNTNIARSSTTVGHSRDAGFGFRYVQVANVADLLLGTHPGSPGLGSGFSPNRRFVKTLGRAPMSGPRKSVLP
jgi:hypothetical protein